MGQPQPVAYEAEERPKPPPKRDRKKSNYTKSNSPQWKSFKPYRDDIKTNGKSGRERRYYTWDHEQNDIGEFDGNGKHLGSMDPGTGERTKPAVPGRSIKKDQMNDTDKCSPDGERRCSFMVRALSDVRLPVIYLPDIRQYGIVYTDDSVQEIYFCPWCGSKLPKPLDEERFERIWDMGLEPEDPRVPEAMLTDQWWKEENL